MNQQGPVEILRRIFKEACLFLIGFWMLAPLGCSSIDSCPSDERVKAFPGTGAQNPIACNLNVFSPAERKAHISFVLDRFFPSVSRVRELKDGFAFRVPYDPSLLTDITQFVLREQRCCPFTLFALRFDVKGGEAWLEATGAEGVKDFLRLNYLPPLAKRHVKGAGSAATQ